MRKLVTVWLIAALLLSVTAYTAHAAFDGFIASPLYTPEMFSDVSGEDWFAKYVETAVDCGFMKGKGGGIFDPGGTLTVGEAVTLAARLRSEYYDDGVVFFAGEPLSYADYALEHEIIAEPGGYNERITRKKFAELIRNALPDEAFEEINDVPGYAICDVVPDGGCADAVYALYRAGIMAGSDRYGTFFPDSYITRAEVCAVLSRIALPNTRIALSLPTELPSEIIYERSSGGVIMLETYDERGNLIRNGSAFFISEDGLAVTNEHVIAGAVNAIATLADGRKYPVEGIVSISVEYDLAVISVDCDDGGFGVLLLADSDLIETGNTVYALGSPLDLTGSVSTGVISNPNREVAGQIFFQFTAAISFGSGGGPVVNSLGQVVGVASSSFAAGQRLNLAVPISLLRDMEFGPCTPLNPYFS